MQAGFHLRIGYLDKQLSSRLAPCEVLLRLLHALSGEGVVSVDVDLHCAVLDEPEELGDVRTTFFGGIDVVVKAAKQGRQCMVERRLAIIIGRTSGGAA